STAPEPPPPPRPRRRRRPPSPPRRRLRRRRLRRSRPRRRKPRPKSRPRRRAGSRGIMKQIKVLVIGQGFMGGIAHPRGILEANQQLRPQGVEFVMDCVAGRNADKLAGTQ